MARSYRILSGCRVSLEMGLSYLTRLNPQEHVTIPASTKTATLYRAIVKQVPSNSCQSSFPRRALQPAERLAGVGCVKNRRPCHQPFTPCAHDLGGVLHTHSAVDLNYEIQS